MVLDPITQAALTLQRSKSGGLAAQAGTTIPVSFGHRVIDGFTIWVSQASAPSLASFTDLLQGNGVNVSNGDTVTIGGRVYTFQTTLTNTDGHVHIAATAADSIKNLINAINGSGGAIGTDYAAATTAHPDVVAADSSGAVEVTQKATSSGTVAVSTTSAALSWSTPELVTSNTTAGTLTRQSSSAPLIAGATHATFAVALGYSLLPAEDRAGTKIVRIWADDELIYDASNAGAAPSLFNGMQMTFHEGLPDADPDLTIKADMGDLTPGFQNLIYVVFNNYPLQVGPTPTAPPPVVTQPAPITTQKVLPYPGIGTVGGLDSYDAGTAWFGPGLGTGQFWLKKPENAAFPQGGIGGYFISWINDSQSRTGHGGGYNSVLATVTPYPVDIGNGITVVAGNEAQDATIQTVTQDPPTVSQAPAAEPSYRTTLPKIRVELSDAVASIPVANNFTLLDNTTNTFHGLFGGQGGFVDYDLGYVYQWENLPTTPASFVEHVYSIQDKIELVRFAPVNGFTVNAGTPEETIIEGANVVFGDTFSAHDTINKMVFTQTAIGNSAPLIMIDLQTGTIKGAYGLPSNALDDVDFISIAIQTSGDVVMSTASGGRAYGLVTGQFLGTQVALTRYNPVTGHMTSGSHVNLPADYTGWHRTNAVIGYPLVGRADIAAKYGLSSDSRQDWFAFAPVGRDISLVQGGADVITANSVVYSADGYIKSTFIDTNDYSLVLIKIGNDGHDYIEKLQIDTVLGAGGATPYVVKSVYNVQLPADNVALNGFNTWSLRESRYANGQLVFPSGNIWFYIDLSTGATIKAVTGPTFLNAWVYDSASDLALALGTDALTPVIQVQLAQTTGAAIPLASVLTWLSLLGNYAAEDISVTGITDTVLGGVIDSKIVLWSYFQNLAKVYGFDFFESEGKIKFTKSSSGDGTQAAYTIDVDSLTTAEGSVGDLKENLITTLAGASELANSVEIGFLDPDFSFQANTKTFQRARFPFRLVQPSGTASYETYLVMTGSEALQRAAAVSFASYAEGVVQNLKLPTAYARLEPGDAINLIVNGQTFLVVLKELIANNDWSFSITGVNYNYKNNVTLSADRPLGNPQQSTGPSDSLALAIDTTLPAATDDPGQAAALIITGVESLGQPWWNGAAFNIMAAGDTAWTRLYFSNSQTPYGRMAVLLPETDTPFRTDTGSYDVVSVTISGGAISGTNNDLLAGTNAAYVGQPGRWELIYYESATWVNAKRFTISTVLRGRRGTDVNCNNHASGDFFIPFNRGAMTMYPAPVSKLNTLLSYAAVGVNTTKSATIESDTLEGNSLKPWAVRYVTAKRLP